MPGEERTVTVDMPATLGKQRLKVGVDGWNVVPASVEVAP
jgi:hypothetical protein